MRYPALTSVLAASLAIAHPVEQRDGPYAVDYAAPPGGDITILNYALTLEYLERKFYQEGLANFTQAQFVAAGFADPFYDNLKEIYYDEKVCIYGVITELISHGKKLTEIIDPRLFPRWCSRCPGCP